jgi:hypothetical protein
MGKQHQRQLSLPVAQHVPQYLEEVPDEERTFHVQDILDL